MARSRPARPKPFTQVQRRSQRGAYDTATLHAVIDSAVYCHVAHIIDDRPVAIPTLHWRKDDRLYWHGSVASRMLGANRAGGEVCVTMTCIDGFVMARCAFNHSANYRSAMVFGVPEDITDSAEKLASLEHFMEHWFPGRWKSLRAPTRKEMAATSVMSLPIHEASAKIRTGGPHDAKADLDAPVWAGVIPLTLKAGRPVPAEDYSGSDRPPKIAKR
ncbi:MAG: pyridoxamine 5'-phosphate oxidase family protein [Steroidobacteraceae bacterium]